MHAEDIVQVSRNMPKFQIAVLLLQPLYARLYKTLGDPLLWLKKS
jgi:hypothetical protein